MPPPTTTYHHPPPPTLPTTSQNISTTTHDQPKYIHQHSPPPTTSQNISTITHHHPKNGPPLSKSQIYSYITSFWHCFNSLFFYKMQYSFPWRRFCVIKFWSVCFPNSKFLRHFTYLRFFKFIFQEVRITRFIIICFYK